jgi:Uma2 family endonuclease
VELADLDIDKSYTYSDYVKWSFKERVELLKGKIFKMSPAPNDIHQKLSGQLFGLIWSHLRGHKCQVRSAPYDVRLSRRSVNDEDIITVLQPDICVICDESKIDRKGCIGAPDIVVEILSPGNNITELKNKFSIYEEAGVKEYWVVSPQDNTFIVNMLVNNKYVPSKIMVAGDTITTPILPGFLLDLEQLFSVL